jgi:DNA-binding NarL/FixJ family response regulator
VVVADRADEEVLRVIRTIRRGSSARVVLVLDYADPDSVLVAADAGAIGALQRNAATGERLAHLVAKAVRGESVLPELQPMDRLASPGPAGSRVNADPVGPPPAAHNLSSRDVEVLSLLADGCDTAEIARRLAYSEPTIKNVIQRLFENLNVRNRPHAVAVALRAGII